MAVDQLLQTVGFIGLGNTGGPVVGHIQRDGFSMVVYDLLPDAMRPFQGTFPLKLLRKDVGLAMALGRELNVSLSLANITEQILIEGINRGWGDKSAYTATFKLEEEAVQVMLRADGVDPGRSNKYISTHPDVK